MSFCRFAQSCQWLLQLRVEKKIAPTLIELRQFFWTTYLMVDFKCLCINSRQLKRDELILVHLLKAAVESNKQILKSFSSTHKIISTVLYCILIGALKK